MCGLPIVISIQRVQSGNGNKKNNFTAETTDEHYLSWVIKVNINIVKSYW